MKKIYVFLIISVMMVNIIGCQSKSTSNKEEMKKVESQNNEEKEDNSTSDNNTNAPKGTVVILPEGMDIPEGAKEIMVEGIEGKVVLIPEGNEIPKGAEVLHFNNGEASGEAVNTEFDNTIGNEHKEKLKEILPTICKDVKKVLVEKSDLIDPQLNMKETQILLVSNAIRTAYLTNSQNEKYGTKDELIEYSTDTIKDTGVLVQGFSIIQFNDKPTYIVNLDFMLAGTPISMLKEELIKFIIHESIHLVLQKAKDPTIKTKEETMSSRAVVYPIKYEDRIYRAKMIDLYKKALQANDNEQKIEYIKKANYFYKKFIEDEQNLANTIFDKIEGEAKFAEFQSIAILNGANTREEVNKQAAKLVLDNSNMFRADDINENLEYYTIGSMAYGLMYELNDGKLMEDNPVRYLLDKYGIIENEGDKQIEEKLKNKYSRKNKKVKKRVDDVTEKLTSDKYSKVVIPVYYKYEENANIMFNLESIQYKYNDQEVTIDNITKEIRLKNSRILLKGAEIVTYLEQTEEEVENFIAMVPNEDIEISNDSLTVQTKNVQIYDAKFIKKDGIYYLQDK